MEFWSSHTIDPNVDEVIVNLGHETEGGQLWVWGLNDAGQRIIKIGTYGNLPIEVPIRKFIPFCFLITTTVKITTEAMR